MSDPRSEPASLHTLSALVENRGLFLDFVGRRLGDQRAAEDIVQNAFLKAAERGHVVRHPESVVPWFYRLLRNAITDHFRHAQAERRALQREAMYAGGEVEEPEAEVERAICPCVLRLLPTLAAAYATLLRKVDMEGVTISVIARQQGTSANAVRVRLHRARRALRRQLAVSCGTCAEHGCLDCTCRDHAAPSHRILTSRCSPWV